MKRFQLKLSPIQIKQLLTLSKLPLNLADKLKSCDPSQPQDIFTNEEEVEKILDLLPPPGLANNNELELREFLTQTFQDMS